MVSVATKSGAGLFADTVSECLGEGAKRTCRSQPTPPFPTCPQHVDQFFSGEIYGEAWDEALDAVGTALDDIRWCTTCLAQLRETDPEYDEAEAIVLSVGDTKHTFEARGHALEADGTVDANASYRLTDEATVEDGALYCVHCGRPSGEHEGGTRSKGVVHDAFDNLLASLDSTPTPSASSAGHRVINVSMQNSSYTDRQALARALAHTLHADVAAKPAQG